MSCLLSLWLKSCDRDTVQSSQELTISMFSDSSAEMRWSMVGMLQPGLTVTDWPDLMVSGDRVPALGQTWLVAMVPMEYTSQVLLPKL